MIISSYSQKNKFFKFKNFKNDKLMEIYKSLYMQRKTEEKIREKHFLQNMKTPIHFGIGQEAISTGVCLNLSKKDTVFSHHRSHLPYLAKGGSVYGLFSELMGKKTGCSGGKGGSVHLTSRKQGFIGSTAILGQSLGLAVGSALAHKIKKKKNISVAFFGNSSLEEGAAYEALNFSRLKNVPTLFVFENNFYSTEMPNYRGYMKNINYKNIIEALDIKYEKVDGNNIAETYSQSQKAIKYIKKNLKPYFIEFETYRWLEHCGPFYDHEQKRNYRSIEELNYWKKLCPIKNFKKFLISKGLEKKIVSNEKKINNFIDKQYQMSLASEAPNKKNLFTNVI